MKVESNKKDYIEISVGKNKKTKRIYVWKDADGSVVLQIEKNKEIILEKVFLSEDTAGDDDESSE